MLLGDVLGVPLAAQGFAISFGVLVPLAFLIALPLRAWWLLLVIPVSVLAVWMLGLTFLDHSFGEQTNGQRLLQFVPVFGVYMLAPLLIGATLGRLLNLQRSRSRA